MDSTVHALVYPTLAWTRLAAGATAKSLETSTLLIPGFNKQPLPAPLATPVSRRCGIALLVTVMTSLEILAAILVAMPALSAWAIAVILHRWIAKAHDLVPAVILDEDRKLLAISWSSLGLVVSLEHFTGIANGLSHHHTPSRMA